MILENGFLIKTVDGITEEMFFDLCQANSELRMERDQHGNIIVMSPTGADTGNYNSELNYEITHWNRQTRLGYVFDSSAGYTLPDGAVRSPDVSWLANDRWESLPKSAQEKFAPICPDFVVEVRSKSDALPNLKAKMEEYRDNGCRLGWLIDRKGKAVHIYRADGSIEITKGEPVKLSGEEVLPGFELELFF
jgi:Uma2 family endonuclease